MMKLSNRPIHEQLKTESGVPDVLGVSALEAVGGGGSAALHHRASPGGSGGDVLSSILLPLVMVQSFHTRQHS